jgi:hypothetical protein
MNAITRCFDTYWSSSIGKKIVVAVTGLLLCLFLAGHLAGNLLIYAGREAFNEYAVRGTEMKYWIYLDDLDERGTLGFQLDVVAYGDTVHTETFSLEDDRTNPEPGRPNYRNGTFVWQW